MARNGTKTGGRVAGSHNKASLHAKDVIAAAAARLGGIDRIVAWAKESTENERDFWTKIYTKLIAIQIVSDNSITVQLQQLTTLTPPGELIEHQSTTQISDNVVDHVNTINANVVSLCSDAA